MARGVCAGRGGGVVSGEVRWAPRGRYLPIAEHGLIGDMHTVALVGTDGTIDWYCCPRFDSPSVFAAILDADHGGLFRISPGCDGWRSKQLYLPDTNILITRGARLRQPRLPLQRGRFARRGRRRGRDLLDVLFLVGR